ncbi:MAG TPA: tRNA (adenosine(37)-N6)-dimethylallyltransferase MiaA [Candidatus Paceibacterota bacterium]|nr:tRNA (adenosine(37)-N6)-dimethylallyltransferase MiaA [Candidatus Paceibacterota bacterium]
MKKPKVYVVVGPTASGKSAYAVMLAKKVGGEIISADSRQVYKGLDIGTGKITKREMQGVPHHLLSVVSPKKVFTAHDYVQRARPILEKILQKGKSAIICGGTGFYIDALLGRITLPNVPPNASLRGKLKGKSAPQLFAVLKKLDPQRAKEIDRHNPVRLIRAIEIAQALGTVPRANMKTNPLPDYEVLWIGMKIAEISLRENIRSRLHERMKNGMVAEAKRLHASGLSYRRMEQLGLEYRQLARLLKGAITREQMCADLEREIFRYAKRQMTYWRKNDSIVWWDQERRDALIHS